MEGDTKHVGTIRNQEVFVGFALGKPGALSKEQPPVMKKSLNISVQHLRYLLAIAKTGSIAAAARELDVSKGTLANALSQTDERLGFSVFLGSRKGVEITPQGREFLNYALRVVNEMDALDERFGNANAAKRLAVATTPFAFAVKALSSLAQRHSGDRISFSVNISYAPQIALDVCTQKKDIGILHLSKKNESALQKLISDEGLEFHELFTTRFFAYMHKGHPLANRESIKYSELALYPSFDLEQYLYLSLPKDNTQVIGADDDNGRQTLSALFDPVGGALDLAANPDVCLVYCNLTDIATNNMSSRGSVAIPLDTDELMHLGYVVRRDHNLTDIEQEYVAELMRFA